MVLIMGVSIPSDPRIRWARSVLAAAGRHGYSGPDVDEARAVLAENAVRGEELKARRREEAAEARRREREARRLERAQQERERAEERLQAYIKAVVDAAPPLTEDQIARLSALLDAGRPMEVEPPRPDRRALVRRVCNECGLESTAGAIAYHQKATGHTGFRTFEREQGEVA